MSQSWKTYLSLLKKKKRQEAGMFMVEGLRICRDALASGWAVEAVFATEAFAASSAGEAFREMLRQHGWEWQLLAPGNFRRLAETESPQGILLVMRLPAEDALLSGSGWMQAGFLLVLQGVRDPGNLGTIIRSADWFGVDGIILSGDCVDPYNPKVLRGTMGSIFHVPLAVAPELTETLTRLKQHGFRMYASAVEGAQAVPEIQFRKPLALILGNEAHGVSGELFALSDQTVRIEQYGRAESLNVGIAGAVLLAHIAGQIYQKGHSTR
ncbi:MAG: RNA methyltransferase [Calditrichaeota bacterium]|nr:RNA methyltransferase [Calditrichota bacterium]MCB0303049.1 RNA methyltransferase [Calditrichota bacterium]MCB0316494.1 RNA methyltransferase [Calditrichota bacterium]MCB9089017.1 RNA methyltransferase [Calditrichia bacterium]